MAWKDGFVIEYTSSQGEPYKVSCKMCVQCEDGFCKHIGWTKLTILGYNSWKECGAFQLQEKYKTESRQRYIDRVKGAGQYSKQGKQKPQAKTDKNAFATLKGAIPGTFSKGKPSEISKELETLARSYQATFRNKSSSSVEISDRKTNCRILISWANEEYSVRLYEGEKLKNERCYIVSTGTVKRVNKAHAQSKSRSPEGHLVSGSAPHLLLKDKHPELFSQMVGVEEASNKEIYCDSNKIYSWKCPKCQGIWQASPAQRVAGVLCPYCSFKKLLPGFNDVKTKIPALYVEWSAENEKTATEVLFCSTDVYTWQCEKCGETWEESPLSRSKSLIKYKKKDDCPSCGADARKSFAIAAKAAEQDRKKAEKTKKLAVSPDINNAISRDIESKNEHFRAEWHPTKNGSLSFEWAINQGALKRVSWLGQCGHSFKASYRDRLFEPACPYCADKFKKKYPLCAEYFDTKNVSTAELIKDGKGELVEFSWRCNRGHCWRETPQRLMERGGCPRCLDAKFAGGSDSNTALGAAEILLSSMAKSTSSGLAEQQEEEAGARPLLERDDELLDWVCRELNKRNLNWEDTRNAERADGCLWILEEAEDFEEYLAELAELGLKFRIAENGSKVAGPGRKYYLKGYPARKGRELID